MHPHLALVLSRRTAGVMLAAAMLGGCITHSADGVAYSTRDDTPNVGATAGTAGGAVEGSGGSLESSKDKRGNTPPGTDRDGHGPASGAIVDPTGAATRGKPY